MTGKTGIACNVPSHKYIGDNENEETKINYNL